MCRFKKQREITAFDRQRTQHKDLNRLRNKLHEEYNLSVTNTAVLAKLALDEPHPRNPCRPEPGMMGHHLGHFGSEKSLTHYHCVCGTEIPHMDLSYAFNVSFFFFNTQKLSDFTYHCKNIFFRRPKCIFSVHFSKKSPAVWAVLEGILPNILGHKVWSHDGPQCHPAVGNCGNRYSDHIY